MSLELSVEKYTLREAAEAAGFQLNTLRSLYGRGHFRIVGGEDKKGRGLAALMTFEDVMCIAVAKSLIDAGVHPRIAFDGGFDFAYTGTHEPGSADEDRAPSQSFDNGFTVLVCHPAVGASRIVRIKDALGFADLFTAAGASGRHTAVCVLLNDVERAVKVRLQA